MCPRKARKGHCSESPSGGAEFQATVPGYVSRCFRKWHLSFMLSWMEFGLEELGHFLKHSGEGIGMI